MEKASGNNHQIETEKLIPEKNLYQRTLLQLQRTLNTAVFMPLLGKDDGKLLADFNYELQLQDEKLLTGRWTGIGCYVDKTERKIFFNFLRDNKGRFSELAKISKVAGGGDSLYGYSFVSALPELTKLINDPDLKEFVLKEIYPTRLLETMKVDDVHYLHDFYQEIRAQSLGYENKFHSLSDIARYVDFSDVFSPSPSQVAALIRLSNKKETLENILSLGYKVPSRFLSLLNLIGTIHPPVDLTNLINPKNYLTLAGIKKLRDSQGLINDPIISTILHKDLKIFSDTGGGYYSPEYLDSTIDSLALLVDGIKKIGIKDEAACKFIDSIPGDAITSFNMSRLIQSEGVLNFVKQHEDSEELIEFLKVCPSLSMVGLQHVRHLVNNGRDFSEAIQDTTHQLKNLIIQSEAIVEGYGLIIEEIDEHPQKAGAILKILNDPKVCSLILPSGFFVNSKKVFFHNILMGDDPYVLACEIGKYFESPGIPLWERIAFFAVNANKESYNRIDIDFPIDFWGFDLHGREIPIEVMSNEDRNNLRTTKVEEGKDGKKIKFSELNKEAKDQFLQHKLRKVIQESMSEEAKSEATMRNKSLAHINQLEMGEVLIHGTTPEALKNIMFMGNLAGECVAKVNQVDVIPFFVDYSLISASDVKAAKSNFKTLLTSTTSYIDNYDKGVTLISRPSPNTINYTPNHALEFAAQPATEITGVIASSRYLWTPDRLLELKMDMCENGLYIPIYNEEGECLFPPEEYDKLSSEYNLDVRLEFIDSSMRIGEQLGGNPGGTYLVPSENGAHKMYVKFVGREKAWNEWLACEFYREYGLAVPEVKVCNVEGQVGFCSKWLDSDQGLPSSTLNDGFLIDAWLANWDIPFAVERNAPKIGDTIVRLDNGGALLFRALGQRKDRENDGEWPFSDQVKEIERGDKIESLYQGMRERYAGLTDDDIRKQGDRMKIVFTDERIESMIDIVQMSQEDREYLKNTLKKRRDYILNHL